MRRQPHTAPTLCSAMLQSIADIIWRPDARQAVTRGAGEAAESAGTPQSGWLAPPTPASPACDAGDHEPCRSRRP
jgi:hypothetical protein